MWISDPKPAGPTGLPRRKVCSGGNLGKHCGFGFGVSQTGVVHSEDSMLHVGSRCWLRFSWFGSRYYSIFGSQASREIQAQSGISPYGKDYHTSYCQHYFILGKKARNTDRALNAIFRSQPQKKKS